MDDFLVRSANAASSVTIVDEMTQSQEMKSELEMITLQNNVCIEINESDQTAVVGIDDFSLNGTISFESNADSTMSFCQFSKGAQEKLREVRKHLYLNPISFDSYVEKVIFDSEKNNACDMYKSQVQELHDKIIFFNTLGTESKKENEKFRFAVAPGMKNLGATCYLNTQLQCLARIIPFVDAILEWRPSESPSRMDLVLSTLQQILAKVAYGAECILTTENFASALGIENNEMQDPNEFARLLLDKMNIALQHSIQYHGRQTESLGTLLPTLFEGRMTYATSCQFCGRVAYKSESFMDINLPIVHPPFLGDVKNDVSGTRHTNTKHSKFNEVPTSIQYCLDHYMHPEELVGDNQYWCANCQAKRDATRSVYFSKLPNVLNLQLCRYVFDRSTQTKVKRTDRVRLPQILKITSEQGSQTKLYRLCSVMKHLGNSAYHGHYIAEAMDWQTGFWFEFNDEKVERIRKDWLCLGYEDSSACNSKEKGCKDAYNVYYVHEPFLRRHAINKVINASDANENSVIREANFERQRRYLAIKE
jgi:ubiquitin C-terminal hydrolase